MTAAIYEIRVAANVFHATDDLEQHEDMLERLQRNGHDAAAHVALGVEVAGVA